jgi:hypothetical protein
VHFQKELKNASFRGPVHERNIAKDRNEYISFDAHTNEPEEAAMKKEKNFFSTVERSSPSSAIFCI